MIVRKRLTLRVTGSKPVTQKDQHLVSLNLKLNPPVHGSPVCGCIACYRIIQALTDGLQPAGSNTFRYKVVIHGLGALIGKHHVVLGRANGVGVVQRSPP